MTHYAHSTSGPKCEWQLLREHLVKVACGARLRLQQAGLPEPLPHLGYLAGLLHDLGKYRREFQEYIRKLRGKAPETRHKQAGAGQARPCLPIVRAILGHHGGIPDTKDLADAVKEGGLVAERIRMSAEADCPKLVGLEFPNLTWLALTRDLYTRLIFSALVDADWYDAAAFDDRIKKHAPEPDPAPFTPQAWLSSLESVIAERAKECKNDQMRAIRDEVRRACVTAAAHSPGVFTLSVPTGGGKTLSSLAFALHHAKRNEQRRIIYVAPFLSILEQNARIIRQALGLRDDDPAVLEHHSLADPPPGDGDETRHAERMRRAENWDAPIVLTTSVQFYESLFSNAPGRCRKLHNVARSVVLLDECQTLPPGLVAPTCAMLRQLTEEAGTTVVLCTATQPAWDHSLLKPDERLRAKEIIPPDANLFSRLKRVELKWPKVKWNWELVATEMVADSAALCIVNTRSAAREVFQQLRQRNLVAGSVFHLSTTMCPRHRLDVLDRVRGRLKAKESCYLVSTQLIEAGVDVDFPRVLRELAPLEAILQGAGRCNREGMLEKGRVVVFQSEEGRLPPGVWYKLGIERLCTDFLNASRPPDVSDPAAIREYFERLYASGKLDTKNVQGSRKANNFATVANDYQIIDEETFPVVVMSWRDHEAKVKELVEAVKNRRSRSQFRALSPYQVNLRQYERVRFADRIVPVAEALDVWAWHGVYDDALGLDADGVSDISPV